MKLHNNANIPKDLPNFIDPSINLDQVKKECASLVKRRATISAGVAVIPVPFLDVAVDAGLLSMLLPEISARFGLLEHPSDIDKLASKDERLTDIKDRIFQFAGLVATRGVVKQTMQGFGSRILAKQVGKFVPFGGQLVAAGLGYTIFTKVAGAHIDECFELAKRIQTQSTI